MTNPLSREALDTVEGLAAAIHALPSDSPVPKGTPGYNRYTTQREHWLGWLGVTAGTGSYERRTPAGRGAQYVYNHIVEPKMLLWLIAASGVDSELVRRGVHAAAAALTLPGKSKAIRQAVSYSLVADALWKNRAR